MLKPGVESVVLGTRGLTKRYGARTVLADVSLAIPP